MMMMKKMVVLIAVVAFLASVSSVAFGRTIDEEKLAVQDFLKLLDVKIVKAREAGQFAKVTALRGQKAAALARWAKLKASSEATTEATIVVPVAPPAPVVAQPTSLTRLFGWGLNSDIAIQYIQDGKHSTIWGSTGVMANLILDDFIGLGQKLGMSADIVKYKLGLGGFYVYGAGGIKALPIYAGGILYLPQWLGGQDSYLTGGLNYVVYGNGQTSGRIGGSIFYGITADFGLGLGKTGFEVGYNVVRSSTITSKGLSFSIRQPIAL